MCPVDCQYFPEDPGPGLSVRDVSFGSVVEGDVWRFQQVLYVPNLFQHILCDVESLRLGYASAQAVKLEVRFHLERHFYTDPVRLDAKDSWRTRDYPESAQGQRLFPLIGLVAIGRGLLVPGSVRLSPPVQHDVVAGRWIVVAPHGRSWPDPEALNMGRTPRPVSLLQIRNEMLFGELLFDQPYVLEALLLSPSELVGEETLGSRLGVLLPYGQVRVSPVRVSPPCGLTPTSIQLGMLSARTTSLYPGESANGQETTFLPCRGGEGVVAARVASEVEALGNEDLRTMESEGPCAVVAATRLTTQDPLVVTLLQHDNSVNPRLLPVLQRWVGELASPLHLDVFNLTESAQKLEIRETNQRSEKCRVETATVDARGECIIPLTFPGIDAEAHGEIPLLVEVLSNGDVVFRESASITLLPSDCLLLRVEDESRDWYRNTVDAVACWVTPDDEAVVEWIAAARRNAGTSMGAASRTPLDAQIEMLWGELESGGGGFQSRSYVTETSASRMYQHVTIPSETLRLRSGNCLDYTVLFASALERLAFRPVVVFKPGHAFLAWANATGDVEGALETTLLGAARPAEALVRGWQTWGEVADRVDKQAGYRAVHVATARKLGLTPIF